MAYSSVILMKITRCDMLDIVYLHLLGDRVSLEPARDSFSYSSLLRLKLLENFLSFRFSQKRLKLAPQRKRYNFRGVFRAASHSFLADWFMY